MDNKETKLHSNFGTAGNNVEKKKKNPRQKQKPHTHLDYQPAGKAQVNK